MNNNLKENHCVFLDVLGFSKEIKKYYENNKSREHLNKFRKAYKDSMSFLKDDLFFEPIEYNNGWKISTFSDNIFLTSEPGHDVGSQESVFSRITSIMGFQMMMIYHGFALRGAWVLEEVCVDTNFIYGNGIVKAAELEKEANHPKVIIDKKVINFILPQLEQYSDISGTPHNNCLLFDCKSNVFFVNYLETDGGFEDRFWKHHKKFIEQKLNEFKKNEKICDKYLWMANYHNYYCKKYKIKQSLIDIECEYKFKTLEQFINESKSKNK